MKNHFTKKRMTPILNGAVYCAPFCGGGCLKSEYDAAVRDSNALAKRLGKGWKTRVWENLGWHWCVFNPKAKLTVYPGCFGDRYSAWFEPGVGQWISKEFKVPEKAVLAALHVAKKHRDELNAAFEAAGV